MYDGLCGSQVSSIKCAIEMVNENKERKARKTLLEGRLKLKSLTDWLNNAQAVVNAYVRYRDKDKGCVSCSKPFTAKFDAGHLRTRKACPQLRFDAENNIFGQCVHCNQHLSGNVLLMREGVIKRIGIDRVDAVLNNHETRRYTIDEAKLIIAEFKLKLKQIDRQD